MYLKIFRNLIYLLISIFLNLSTNFYVFANTYAISEEDKDKNTIGLLEDYLDKLPNEDYILGPGDQLFISVADNIPNLSKFYTVDGTGTIYLPKLDRTFVSGLTITELNSALNSKFGKFIYEPNVQVRVVNYRPIRIIVDGEVQDPGVYTMPGSFNPIVASSNNKDLLEFNSSNYDLSELNQDFENIDDKKLALFNTSKNVGVYPSVFEALRLAGGITPYSDLSDISVIRINSKTNGGGKIKASLNFLDLINNGDNEQNIRIFDGDVIKIKKSQTKSLTQLSKAIKSNLNPKYINVFVTGMIENPGVKIVSRSASLNDAIDMAGGKKILSGPIKLIRINSDGSLDKRKISYNRRSKPGTSKNPYLREKDILYIGRSKFNVASSAIEEVTSPFVGIFAAYSLFDDFF